MALKNLINFLLNGFKIGNNLKIFVGNISGGRFREEFNLEIFLSTGSYSSKICYMKVFFGRGRFYRPWIEIFGIVDNIVLGDHRFSFFGSEIEYYFLGYISRFVEPNVSLFIEYFSDIETSHQVSFGIPAPATRLGYTLFKLGFTWFKLWYFPEGFFEGGQKIQAEKPVNRTQKLIHLNSILEDLKAFLNKVGNFQETIYIRKSIQYAKNIIKIIEEEV